ncbi:MAG: carbohydrate kinase family protein [Oscillospiraceae bacterium]|nr:carbohydrate kinase family protein [Oscillospiraceae bacterium]
MKKGICCAGNMIVDTTYPIDKWPKQGELVHITEGMQNSTGGAVCNTVIDLARLDPSMHLMASGFAGHDPEGDFMLAELQKYPNIDLSAVKRSGRTSFTLVMSNNETKERTFFQHIGAAATYGEDDIDFDALDVDIFHIGYILLLPHLDEPDEEYGTKMARLLHRAQSHGLKTSIDVVSETGDRFVRLVRPALRYADYCVINELEAQQTTGVLLRDEDGILHRENLPAALTKLRELGVSTWAVIHCPELGAGMDETGAYVEMDSLKLPKGFIKGTVGAGDAFCAGVLHAAENGFSLREALKLAVCTAAASLRSVSASDGVESADAVCKLYDLYKGGNKS